MSRIAVDSEIPEELEDLFTAATNGRRAALNLHNQMVGAPAVLAAYVGIRRALEEHSTLDRRARSALMLAVSSANRCVYTLAVNTRLAARAGLDESQIHAIATGRATGNRPLDAMLAVARAAATGHGRVAAATWRAALDAGASEHDLAEAYASIALAVYVDHFVNYADTPFDVPAAAQAA
jgi:AhpD family alkylhydroperoxidase